MHQATPEVISLLEANGWTVECERPFEIRHDDGSFATLQGAHAVVADLLAELEDELEATPLANMTQAQAFAELEQVAERVQRLADVAAGFGPEDGTSAQASDVWQTAFDLIFSDENAKRAGELCKALNRPMSYYDPDAGYEDDVRAYQRALTEHVAQLKPFFA